MRNGARNGHGIHVSFSNWRGPATTALKNLKIDLE
jgi:hypothetical protein